MVVSSSQLRALVINTTVPSARFGSHGVGRWYHWVWSCAINWQILPDKTAGYLYQSGWRICVGFLKSGYRERIMSIDIGNSL